MIINELYCLAVSEEAVINILDVSTDEQKFYSEDGDWGLSEEEVYNGTCADSDDNSLYVFRIDIEEYRNAVLAENTDLCDMVTSLHGKCGNTEAELSLSKLINFMKNSNSEDVTEIYKDFIETLELDIKHSSSEDLDSEFNIEDMIVNK